VVQVLGYRGSGSDVYGKEGDGNDTIFLYIASLFGIE